MILNYVSSDIIIAKILSDLDIQEEGQRITDIREWIFEAIEKIGAAPQYEYVESGIEGTPYLELHDFQAPLPANVFKLQQVAYSMSGNGPWRTMRAKVGGFRYIPKTSDTGKLVIGSDGRQNVDDLPFINPDLVVDQPIQRFDDQYFLKPGFIVTNRRSGYLKLSYTSIVTDERGYPMVPDLSSYHEAVYWYVVMKLKFPEFMDGRMPENRYNYIHNRWQFYRGQAYAEALMPTEGEMISIKNEWLKLYPEVHGERDGYRNIGKAQNIYNW